MHRRSVRALAEELERSRTLGADYYVLHPGNHLGSGLEQGLARLAEALDSVDAGDSAPMVLLENTAGGGSSVGGDIAGLATVLGALEDPSGIGLAFDTAHAYAAGYRIGTPGGLRKTLETISSTFGLDRLRLIHANDTKAELGSHRDRHEHIGKGRLGRKGLRNFLSCRAVRGLPIILETPVDEEGDDERNLKAIIGLAPRGERGGRR